MAERGRELDHVAKLGANMIEVLPIVEFPGDFSWGYKPGVADAVTTIEHAYVAS